MKNLPQDIADSMNKLRQFDSMAHIPIYYSICFKGSFYFG